MGGANAFVVAAECARGALGDPQSDEHNSGV